jgi:hypothetical protein
MEKIVELVMRPQRQSDMLDRMVLGLGALSLAVAVIGTLAATADDRIARDIAPLPEVTEAA